MIRQYTENNIPKRFNNLFTVGVYTVLVVPNEYIDMVAGILTDRKYTYKSLARKNDMIFGIQYQREG